MTFHTYTQRGGEIREQRMMFFSYEERQSALEHAESQGASGLQKKVDPDQQVKSHTEKIAGKLLDIQRSWSSYLTLRQGALMKQSVNEETQRRLREASSKWNSWLDTVWRWHERRQFFHMTRVQVMKDLQRHLELERTELHSDEQRFGRAATFLKSESAPLSGHELLLKQRLSTRLGSLKAGFERKAPVGGKALETLEAARDAKMLLWTRLEKAGIPAGNLEVLFNSNLDGNPALIEEINRVFAGDRPLRRRFVRIAKKLRWYKRMNMLDALQPDADVGPIASRMKKVDTEEVRGQSLLFTVEGKQVRGKVLSRKSPMLVVHDLSKREDEPGALFVFDTKGGFVLMRRGDKDMDHDLRKPGNGFSIPPSTARMAA